jgi:sensor c-di-GMP phosphodiesterase-like protein
MQRRARDRLRIEADLHQALRREELLVLYQPIVDLNREISGLRGAGALGPSDPRHGLADGFHSDRRGNRPDRADRHLGAAAILPPGACLARSRRPPDLFVSVNVSSRQLDSPDLPDIVRRP